MQVYYPSSHVENWVVQRWAEARIPHYSASNSYCVWVQDEKEILCVAVYQNYRVVDIELSFAADTPRWATRSNILELLRYPFELIKVNRISCIIDKRNKPARKLVKGIGWTEEGTMRMASHDGKPMCLYGLTIRDFERIKKRYG